MNSKATVLMPVYNSEKYLKGSIESILNQTFKYFEFIIINDGSTDKSAKIIKSYNDKRIRFIENEKNLGLIATLNKGINLAQGEYIVRMDADDISLPERLEKQVNFMDNNPEIGVCGSWLTTIGDKKSHLWKFPVSSEEIKANILFSCPFAHPAVIIRKSIFISNNLFYSPEFMHGEEYELWTRCIRYTNFANIPEVLLLYRRYKGQISDKFYDIQQDSARKARENLFKDLNFEFINDDLKIHDLLVYKNFKERSKEQIISIEDWLNKIIEANDENKIFDKVSLLDILGQRWFLACRKSSSLGFWAWKKYWKSEFSINNVSVSRLFLFWLTCLLRVNG